MNTLDEPLLSKATISSLYSSSLLLPVPLGRPIGSPFSFRALKASEVLLEIRSRSISLAIEKIDVTSKSSPDAQR